MGGKNLATDPYRLHRAALLPLLLYSSQADLEQAIQQIANIGEAEFLTFLQQQGLASMWDKVLEESGHAHHLSQDFRKTLHQDRLSQTGTYLIHRNKLKAIREILDAAAISHAVYKGADSRERYYDIPSLRPAADVDVLVPEDQKLTAIEAFKQEGYDFHAKKDNISHEINLVKGFTSIDLHWDIMRPGRTRIPMTETLLHTRRDFGSHWGMSDEANLFVLLVHPVFTKYSTTPQATLMRTVDLVQLMGRKELRWQESIELLESAGLKTAAWITLRWVQLVTGSGPAQKVTERLAPGKLRQKYLNWWLEQNVATRLLDKPGLVQLGFTLPAHDKPKDALRAIRLKRHADRSSAEELLGIERNLA